MVYDVSIDKDLFSVYSEIRLGLLRFHADVKASDDHFWDYDTCQPAVYRNRHLCMETQKTDVVLVRKYGKRI